LEEGENGTACEYEAAVPLGTMGEVIIHIFESEQMNASMQIIFVQIACAANPKKKKFKYYDLNNTHTCGGLE